jgi:hypothetical protein
LNEDGLQLLLVPIALPTTATLTPTVVKSIGDVEKRILNPEEKVSADVQLKVG